MSKKINTRVLCFYLRRYLERTGVKGKKRLRALYAKQMGEPLGNTTLWRHLTLRKEPTFSAGIVYMTFLRREGAIEPNGRTRLFMYVFPELLREKK